MELYKKYRPKKLADIRGQDELVKVLSSKFKGGDFPHAVLISGPSGCGKTTLARIIRRELGCQGGDYREVDCGAEDSPIDAVRTLKRRMRLFPSLGSCRVFLLDEVQALSKTKFAQQAMLKMLEEVPSHTYFILCTTDPGKLLPTIITRCMPLRVRPLADGAMRETIGRVLQGEGKKITDAVIDRILERAGGSARQALMLLEEVVGLSSEKDQLEAVAEAESESAAVDLARALTAKGAVWKDVAGVLKAVEDLEPEAVRRAVLGYCRSIVLGGGKFSKKAWLLIENLKNPFPDDTRASHALLASACYSVFNEI